MKHGINAPAGSDGDLIFAQLSQLGDVTWPNREILYFELIAPEEAHDSIHALGLDCCCANTVRANLSIIQAVGPEDWHLGAVSGGPLDKYEYDATGGGIPVYLVDTPVEAAPFNGRVVEIHNPHGGMLAVDHGTNMAGFIGHATHGIAKDALIYSVAAFNENAQASVSEINAAFSAVLSHKNSTHPNSPAIVNCSFTASGFLLANPFSAALTSLKNAGCLVVASSGNAGVNLDTDAANYWPAESPDVFTVGAHDASAAQAWFSNHGSPIDILAPGVGCQTIDRFATPKSVSGTSGAAASVSGAAACFAHAGETDLRQALLANAVGGVLHKPGILLASEPPPPAAEEPAPTGTLRECALSLADDLLNVDASSGTVIPFSWARTDHGGWFDGAGITVPDGINSATVGFIAQIDAAEPVSVMVTLNGYWNPHLPRFDMPAGGILTGTSKAIAVTPGMRFALRVICGNPVSIGKIATQLWAQEALAELQPMSADYAADDYSETYL